MKLLAENIHLWMLLVLCTVVYSRISLPHLQAVNFASAIEGRKLNGSVVKEIEVDGEESCKFLCLEEERCQSYNIGTKRNAARKFKCQLSDSDRFVGFVTFTEDKDFKYGGLQVIL